MTNTRILFDPMSIQEMTDRGFWSAEVPAFNQIVKAATAVEAYRREEAAKQATQMGQGLLVIVNDWSTDYYASTDIPVGTMEEHRA